MSSPLNLPSRDARAAYKLALEKIQKWKLSGEQWLSLSGLELTALPPEIGELKAVTRLSLHGNQLTDLPPEIGQLAELTLLSLDNNQLATLPKEIGHLTGLRELYLHHNGLTALPETLRELKELRHLSLHDNDALRLPPEVLGAIWMRADRGLEHASPKSILEYYFSKCVGGARPLDEVKLVIVGRGGVGKSSLVERLMLDRFAEGKEETVGVVLSDWSMRECPGGGPVTAHVWDFAGQAITHSTHQFFFSVRALYVLVLTGRENSERDDAEYWLRLIAAFGTDAEGNGPPVIVALNKWDESASRPRIDRLALRERFPFIVEIIETDCATGTGIATLRKMLCQVAGGMQWVRVDFPNEFRAVKEILQTMREAHLGYDEYRERCRENGVPDEGKQDSLAEILHRLGVALNYRDDPRLRDATVLKPHWLTENVYALVRYAEKRAGVLRREKLEAALPKEKDAAMREYLVRIMERFELAYPLEEGEEGRETRQWLVPLGLPDNQPKGIEAFARVPDTEATRLRFRYAALPAGLVARFTVRVHPFIEGEARWASGVVLALEGARALVRSLVRDEVEITVTGPAEARRNLAGLCQREFREIHSGITGLNPVEEMRAVRAWVPVTGLEKAEAMRRSAGEKVTTEILTTDGPIEVQPTRELNEFTVPAARDDSWKPRVFISYSKHDAEKRRQFVLRLKLLMGAGLVDEVFHDRMIQPGEDWDAAIRRKLEESHVFVFLVSAEMLATDYVAKVELARAMERRADGKAVVVPVILEPCGWELTTLSGPNALPEKGRALTSYTPRANGWQVVSEGLKTLFTKLREQRV